MSSSEEQKSANVPPDSFHWFISQNGQRQGPMANAEFQKLVGLGQLAPTDFVWRTGMENWVPASEVLPPRNVQSHEATPAIAEIADEDQRHQKKKKKQRDVKVRRYVRAHGKSYGFAIILAMLFGPLGLFYVGIGLGFAVTIIELYTLFNMQDISDEAMIGASLILVIVNIIIAIFSVIKHNHKVKIQADLLIK